MNWQVRDLRADEIECRVGVVAKDASGFSVLLYKDARCDMTILDETFGPQNWMRTHSRDNANCTISVWDSEKGQWISKEDTGTESNTEAEKGLASDSFKRSGVNWGIGRELYTAPFIYIKADAVKWKNRGGKQVPADDLTVTDIGIENKRIVRLELINERTGAVVYSWKEKKGGAAKPKPEPKPKPAPVTPIKKDLFCESCGRLIDDPDGTWEGRSRGACDGLLLCKACGIKYKADRIAMMKEMEG